MKISNNQSIIIEVLTMLLGYGFRSKGYKISGNLAMAIGAVGIPLTIWWDDINKIALKIQYIIPQQTGYAFIAAGLLALIIFLAIFYQARRPKGIYLTGKEACNKHGITLFELKQRVDNGMPAYMQKSSEGYRTDNLEPVSKRDLIACEEWPKDDVKSWIEKWLFKTADIEKYIKTT